MSGKKYLIGMGNTVEEATNDLEKNAITNNTKVGSIGISLSLREGKKVLGEGNYKSQYGCALKSMMDAANVDAKYLVEHKDKLTIEVKVRGVELVEKPKEPKKAAPTRPSGAVSSTRSAGSITDLF